MSQQARIRAARALGQAQFDLRVSGRRGSALLSRLIGAAGALLPPGLEVLPRATPNASGGWRLTIERQSESVAPARARGWIVGKGEPILSGAKCLKPSKVDYTAVTFGSRLLHVSDAAVTPGMSIVCTADSALLPECLDVIALSDGSTDPHGLSATSPWLWPRGRRNRFLELLAPAGTLPVVEARARQFAIGPRHRPDIHLASAISLFDSVDNHFGHWFFDILVRLSMCEAIPANTPVLVSTQAPKNAVVAVRLMRPAAAVVAVDPGRVVQVGDLTVPLEGGALWHRVPYESRGGHVKPVRAALIDVPQLCRMTGTLRRAIGGTTGGPNDKRPVLWLRRDKSPNSQFEDEVEVVRELQSRLKLDAVYLETVPLQEISRSIGSRPLIIVPDGSVAANLTLLRTPTRILLVVDEVYPMLELGVIPMLEASGHEVLTLSTSGSQIADRPENLTWLAELIERLAGHPQYGP